MSVSNESGSIATVVGMPGLIERRETAATPRIEPFVSTPIYDRVKNLPTRAARALQSITEILKLMEEQKVMWQLKGKLARGGFNLMPENENTPPQMAAKLAYTELEVLRLRLTNLVMYPPAPTRSNPDPLNNLTFSAEDELDILHAIRREANNYLRDKGEDGTFQELKNLCQLTLGNLQQMALARRATQSAIL